ncbi:MAG: RNA-binding transcriptional accessory protein [Desulfuromonas sp.]|nr:MAG: RNA-binding transcriptional accessory protein [Desulfuromonas sp.]
MSNLEPRIINSLLEESALKQWQVKNTVELLCDGATVPFISRYRKERTGELDEVQVRTLAERYTYFCELEDRKTTIVSSIEEQGLLTADLQSRIRDCRQKVELEDLYLPFQQKRRTRATIARERGLEPLADLVMAQGVVHGDVEKVAAPFVSGAVEDASAALTGAGHIIAERLSERSEVRAMVRKLTWAKGSFHSRAAKKQGDHVSKFEMYYDYQEPLTNIPSHRMLAMRRGEQDGLLRLSILAPEEEILRRLRGHLIKKRSIFSDMLEEVAADCYKRLLAPAIEAELRLEAKQRADVAAISVFAENLRNLLLAAPAGGRRILAVDPGLRTGSKLVVLDATGRPLENATIYPHAGPGKVESAGKILSELLDGYGVKMVAVGNGTAGREMDRFVRETLAAKNLDIPVVMVNEAGASVYSASDVAREEFPDLDVTIRGAVSIGRRLQDPLAELVKIDAKSIGVGQYQHDVNQAALQEALDAVVESCVNHVGVNLNTASASLLGYVSGIGPNLARNIVVFRDEHGALDNRHQLLGVPRFGPKAFEQAAGFLRIPGGDNPLDNTAVHPENYRLVARIAADLNAKVDDLAGQPERIDQIDLNRYISSTVGLPTLKDIVSELRKPGRDPREEFHMIEFREDVREISDLREGMLLSGSVTNVAAFGAFVDIGVHQDGLVHISELANRFVKDPNEVVRVGDIVRVKVLSIDKTRKRIGLSIKAVTGE